MKNLFIIGQGIYDPKMIVSVNLEHKSRKAKAEKRNTEKRDCSCCGMYRTAEAK